MLKDEESRFDDEVLLRFNPNRAQKRFLESKKRVRAFIASNKIGKTTAGCIDLTNFALQGGKICRVVGSLGFEKGIRDVIIPELMKWIPKKNFIKSKPNSQGIPIKIYIRGNDPKGTQSIISFMSGEQDDMVFEGDMMDYAWIDEPCRQSIYTATLRGLLVSNGPLIFTFTPLSEPWTYNEIYMSGDPEIECFQGNIWDACNENPGGHLTREQIQSFVDKIPEDEKPARVFGEFKHLIGRVFKEFSLEKHVVEPFRIPPDWPVYCSIDPHQRKPHAVAWMAVSPEENWYICNEVYFSGGIEDLGMEIAKVSRQYRTVCHLIDTSSETPDWQRRDTARTILDKVFRKERVPITTLARKKNQKDAARFIIKQALEGKDGKGIPWLFVFKTCKRTKFEFLNYVWDNFREPESKGLKEEPKKLNDDIIDNIHYIVVEKPRFSRPKAIDIYGD